VKILINCAGWFGQSNELGNTLRIRSKAVLVQGYLETIEGAGPFIGEASLEGRLTVEIVRPGIDFQLGTNAADTNGSSQ
jgi:hypothetical protein